MCSPKYFSNESWWMQMIIDFHTHAFPDKIARNTVEFLSKQGSVSYKYDGSIGDLHRSMNDAFIGKSVILPIATKPSQTTNINDWAASVNSDDIIAFGSIHPQNSDYKEELLRIKELGLLGIKLHPQYQEFYIDDKNMLNIYDYAFSLGLIIIFHAGVDIGLPPPVRCTPDRINNVIDLFEQGKVVFAHMGGFKMWDEVENLLLGRNIYFDTSFCIDYMNREQFKRIVMLHGYEKILFGSDGPWQGQGESVEYLKSMDFGDEITNAILGENAEKILEGNPNCLQNTSL